ncbi:hypothetical protein V2K41_01230 [Pseudomonas alliivorans]|nr:hypothetical protein [Pseudomonas alliivorans]
MPGGRIKRFTVEPAVRPVGSRTSTANESQSPLPACHPSLIFPVRALQSSSPNVFFPDRLNSANKNGRFFSGSVENSSSFTTITLRVALPSAPSPHGTAACHDSDLRLHFFYKRLVSLKYLKHLQHVIDGIQHAYILRRCLVFEHSAQRQ